MNGRHKPILGIATLTLFLVLANNFAFSQDGPKTNKTVSSPNKKASVDIQNLAWIVGHWKGEALGGKFEETWTAPLGGTMLGMFKLTKGQDQLNFTELLSIQPKGQTLVLRVKHFDSEFVGWETKDKFAEFPLIEATDTVIKFDGLVFKKKDANQMTITVRVGQKDGKTQNLVFNCKRAQLRSEQQP